MNVVAHYLPNPITLAGHTTRHIALQDAGTTYDDIRRQIGAPKDTIIVVGGRIVEPTDVVAAPVVSFHRKAEDPIGALAFFFVDASLFFGSELAAATLFVQVGTVLALTYAVNAIFKADESELTKIEDTPNAYSVSATRNSTRSYQSIPVVMGSLRVSPDVDARAWTQFVDDPENIRTQTYITTASAPYTAAYYNENSSIYVDTGDPAFQPYPTNGPDYGELTPWYLYTGTIYRTQSFVRIGDSYNYLSLYHDTSTGLYTTNISTPDWQPFSVATVYTYNVTQTAQIPETTVQLNQFFNFGLGDLTISDLRLGQTPLDKFKGVVSRPAAFETTRTAFTGAPSPEFSPYTALGSDWRTNVLTVEGGELRQNANVADSGYVTRASYTDNIEFIQVDLSGSLWFAGNGGPEIASCDFQIQYRPVGGAWVTPPGIPATINLSNADSFPVRRTFGWATTVGQQYEVRVRKVTTDSDDARLNQDFEFTQLKFFRPDYDTSVSAAESTDRGAAQNRYAISVRAGGQINGTIDDFNALVTASCWVWTGTTIPTSAPPATGVPPSPPGPGGGWVWTTTENPAWWYLYWLRGLFLDTGTTQWAATNWQGWNVSPETVDRVRMAGCGIEWSRIDIESIVLWAQYCDANNLTFSAVVTEQSSAFETLGKIARIGRASPSWHTGKLGVVFEDKNEVPIASFGMPNIVAGSFQMSYLGENVPEEIVVGYTDPDEDWKELEVRKTVPGFILPNNELQVRLWGCKSKAQAQREANLLAARQFFQRRRVTFETSQEGLLLRRGNVIYITHDLTMWAASSRLADGSAGTFVRLVRRIDQMGANPVYVKIVAPDGTEQIGTTTVTAETHELTVTGVNVDFAAFPDAAPEDWIAYISPEATPGKKFRVTSVEPKDGRTVTITAADERPEMWAYEFSGTPTEADLGDSGEHLVATIRGLGVTQENCEPGWFRVEWENLNARGAVLTIAPPGGASNSLNVLGDSLLLQGPIADGTIFSATPLLDLPAVAIQSDTFTYQ